MVGGRRTGSKRPRRRRHRREHRHRLPHGRRTGLPRRTCRAGGAQPREGQRRAVAHHRRQPARGRHAAGARPELAGLGAFGRRRAARDLPAHRPADQQRRRDVDAEAGHQGRLPAAECGAGAGAVPECGDGRRCRRCGPPPILPRSTTAPTVSSSSAATPRSSDPARSSATTICSVGSGRSPKSSPASPFRFDGRIMAGCAQLTNIGAS